MTRARRVGFTLAGVAAVGLAAASGTALASSASMSGMAMSSGNARHDVGRRRFGASSPLPPPVS